MNATQHDLKRCRSISRFAVLALAACFATVIRPALAEPVAGDLADSAPAAVVNQLHDTLLAVMKDGTNLGFDGRMEKLSPVIDESFDFVTIGRLVLGRHWAKMPEDDKRAFLASFTKLSKTTYADRFDDYSGETFATLAVEPYRERFKLVRTELVKGNGESVGFVYVLREDDTAWRIINVIVDGVSDVSLKKAEYSAVIRDEGVTGLLAKLDRRIADSGSGS